MIYGWISPFGEYFDCEFMGHYDLACEFVEAREYRIVWDHKCLPADEVLVRYGWIKAYTSMFDRTHVQLYGPTRITESQKEILRNDYFDHPENWDKYGKYLLEEWDVIEPNYDEEGYHV